MDFFNFHYIITILRKDRHVTFKKKKVQNLIALNTIFTMKISIFEFKLSFNLGMEL